MTDTYGFNCPEGTRLIIQRPDGFFTALVEGTVRIVTEIEHGGPIDNPESRVVGGRVSMDLKATETPSKARGKVLWSIGLGSYEDADI